jgi:hypothetical protein
MQEKWLHDYSRNALDHRKQADNPYFPRIPVQFCPNAKPVQTIRTGDSFNSLCRITDTIVATGHQQQGVKVWDIRSEKCICTLANTPPHVMKDVWSMCAIHDEQIVISSWFDKRLLIFNWRTGDFVCEYSFSNNDTVALGKKNLIFFGDRYLIAGTKGGWIHVWDTRDNLSVVYSNQVTDAGGWCTAIEIIQNTRVAFVVQSGIVCVFDLNDDTKVLGYTQHHGWAMCSALISQDVLCSGSFEGEVLTWDASDPSKERKQTTEKFGCIRDIVALGCGYAALCHSSGVDVVSVNNLASKVQLTVRGCINACVLPDGILVCGIQAGEIVTFKIAETRSGGSLFYERLWRCQTENYFSDCSMIF